MQCSKVQAVSFLMCLLGTGLISVSLCTDNWLYHEQGVANNLVQFEQRRGLWRQCIVSRNGQLGVISPGCQNLFAPIGAYDANPAIYGGGGLGSSDTGSYGGWGGHGGGGFPGLNAGPMESQYTGMFGNLYRPYQGIHATLFMRAMSIYCLYMYDSSNFFSSVGVGLSYFRDLLGLSGTYGSMHDRLPRCVLGCSGSDSLRTIE